MAGQAEDRLTTADASRLSTLRFLVRLVALVLVPIAALGAALWWMVGSDRIDRTLELRAQQAHRIVELGLADALPVEGGVLAVDEARLDTARRELLAPLLGAHRLRILEPDGTVVYADEATGDNGGLPVALGDVERSALQGAPQGVRATEVGAHAARYALPWAPDDGPTVGLVELSVVDDPTLAGTLEDVHRLAFLFGGAFLALLIALGPLCWWTIGQIRRQFHRTRVAALQDNLTGLANRTQFHDRLDEAIAGAGRGNGRVGLVMVDLDGFKAINDTGGHAAGDRLLKRVAAGLQESTRRNELACRLGGDEFAVIVPRLGSRDELIQLADRLHERLDLNVPFSDGRSLRVTASLGLAVYPDDAEAPDELVNVADLGMYNVKASRKAKLPATKNRFRRPVG